MNFKRLSGLLLLLGVVALRTAAQDNLDTSVQDDHSPTTSVQVIIDTITAFQFRRADEQIRILQRHHPQNDYTPYLTVYKFYWRFLLAPYDEKSFTEFDLAIQALTRGVDHADTPRSPESVLLESLAYMLNAIVLYEKGRPFQAWSRLRQGLRVVESIRHDSGLKGDVDFILGCYEYYRLRKDTQTALDLFASAGRQGMFFRNLAWLMRAHLLQHVVKDLPASLRLYRQLAERYPANSLIAYYLAKTLERTGEYRRSIRAYQATLATITYNPKPLELFCRIYFSMGQIYEIHLRQLPDAYAAYARAKESADYGLPETVRFMALSDLHMGLVMFKMNEYSRAREHLERVRREDDAAAYRRAQEIKRDIANRQPSP